MDLSAITAASATPVTAAKSTSSNTEGGQDYFLKLLVAQMNNQDPLNPLDSAQMTSQLAQLNTVQGINNVAAKLDSLLSANVTAQSMQATALVGHTVMAPGTSLTLANGQAIGGINLASAADHVTVSIKDASGTVVHTADLGSNDAGLVDFAWDGSTDSGAAAAPGHYTFSVAATASGTKVVADTMSTGVVSSVTPGATGASLAVNGLGSFALGQVKQIY